MSLAPIRGGAAQVFSLSAISAERKVCGKPVYKTATVMYRIAASRAAVHSHPGCKGWLVNR